MSEYSIAHVLNHVEVYTDLLIQRFKKPRRMAVLAAILAEVQLFEDAAYDVLTKVNLDDGEGAQLDLIGKVINVRRNGLSDSEYRLRMRVEILILRSKGRPEDLIKIIDTAYSGSFKITEVDFATTYVELLGTTTLTVASSILGFLKRAKATGTRVLVQFTYDSTRTFTFSPDTTEPVDAAHGFGDSSNPGTGGLFSSVLA